MQRYNIFHQIHKGLRAMLYETALHIQHADFWNIDETEVAIEKINEVIRLFDKHAFSEDNHVFPAVEQYDPAIADAFEQEHIKDHLLGKSLAEAITRCQLAPVITEKAEVAKEVQARYIKFMVFNLEHMAKEEEVLNRILWRYYSDEELMAITRQIIAEVPADYIVRYERGSFQSGYCILEAKKVVVLNKFLNTEGRINTLIDLLPSIKLTYELLTVDSQKMYDEVMGQQVPGKK